LNVPYVDISVSIANIVISKGKVVSSAIFLKKEGSRMYSDSKFNWRWLHPSEKDFLKRRPITKIPLVVPVYQPRHEGVWGVQVE
jgi:hypothetical protein